MWWAFTRDVNNALATFESWLSHDEAERCRQFRRLQDRELYLVARAALRHTLSRYADVPPQGWRFVQAEGGRPELAPPFDTLGLRFSVSHTQGLVACAVSHAVAVGVDVQAVNGTLDVSPMVAMACSGAEREQLERLAPHAARTRFYELWTLKEACVKARGAGLALPLNGVTFEGRGEPIEVSFSAPASDDARHWQFALWRPGPEHQGAVALRRGTGPRHTFVYRRALELAAP